jgi:hypothetical protein
MFGQIYTSIALRMDVAHLRQDFDAMRTQIVVEYYYLAPTHFLMFLYSITGNPRRPTGGFCIA